MNRLLFCFLLLATAISADAAAQKFNQITRAVGVITNSSIFLVSTQDATGRWRTRTIDLPTLGTNVSQWATGALGGGVSQVQYTNSVTNADIRRIYMNALTTTNPVQSSGGNARHSTAVDLQAFRDGATYVASGSFSSIHGGSNNTASAHGSMVIGGIGNTSSGAFSISGGSGNIAADTWAIALGFDNFVRDGSEYGVSIGGTDNQMYSSIQGSIYGGGGNIVSNAAIGTIIGSENSRVWGDYSGVFGGSDNVASNTYAIAIGDRNRSLGHYGMTLGHYLTNTESYAIKIGFGTTPVTISSNGLVRILGSLDATNIVTFRAQNDTLTLDPGANNASSLNFSQDSVELYDILAASDAGSLRFRENGTTVFQIAGTAFRVFKSASFDTNISVGGNVSWTEHVVSGTGGANTNFTLLSSYGKSVINGSTNVSIRAIMGGADGSTYTFSITITNGSGSNRTLEFSAVTNAWKWSYAQSATAPTTLTNSEQIVITGELRNTNITAAFAYYPWP